MILRLLQNLLDSFEEKITTPHILTEVSNLFGNKSNLHVVLKEFLKLADEKFIRSAKVAENKMFVNFGLTDTALVETSKDSFLILTDDKPFFGYMIGKGIDAVSLDQIILI